MQMETMEIAPEIAAGTAALIGVLAAAGGTAIGWFAGRRRMRGSAVEAQEADARSSRELLHRILEASPIAVNITTRDGRFLHCNPQLPKTLGIERERMRTLDATTLYVDSTMRARLLARLEAEGPFRDAEIAFRRPDGSTRWLLSSWDHIRYEGEDALLTWLYDITDRKRAEEEAFAAREAAERALGELKEAQDSLIQAEAMASLGQLVAGVTHDLNTPIGIGVTAASHLEQEVRQLRAAFDSNALRKSQLSEFMDTLEESARLIVSNMDRAAGLVRSFKRVAVDQSSGERRSFEVAPYIDEIVSSLGPRLKRGKVRVTVDCEPDIVMDSFPGALSQVLTNLIVNGVVHAFDDGSVDGSILIAAKRLPGDGAAMVEIQVADDGVGMDGAQMERIFEAFYSTRRDRGGTGLGLHIVETLATGPLGGRVEATSSPGRGTRFFLTLPLVAP